MEHFVTLFIFSEKSSHFQKQWIFFHCIWTLILFLKLVFSLLRHVLKIRYQFNAKLLLGCQPIMGHQKIEKKQITGQGQCFFQEFFKKPKWQSSIGRSKKSGDHPQEDLAKSGYKSCMKQKTSLIFLYCWHTLKTKYRNLEIFTPPPSFLAIENLQKTTLFLNFWFFFFG